MVVNRRFITLYGKIAGSHSLPAYYKFDIRDIMIEITYHVTHSIVSLPNNMPNKRIDWEIVNMYTFGNIEMKQND